MSTKIIPHSTQRILTEAPREQVIEAQHDALDMFMFLRRNEPEFAAEERRNRARMERAAPVLDTKTLVRAVIAGAITPDEAVVLWHRIKG